MEINSNNFLIWDGNFAEPKFPIFMNVLGSEVAAPGVDYVDLEIPGGTSSIATGSFNSTYGVDTSSIKITYYEYPSAEAQWIQRTGKVRVYRPDAPHSVSLQKIKLIFRDLLGNVSSESNPWEIDFQ